MTKYLKKIPFEITINTTACPHQQIWIRYVFVINYHIILLDCIFTKTVIKFQVGQIYLFKHSYFCNINIFANKP